MGSDLATSPVGGAPEVVAGRYRIEREIGHGGKARVYLARDRLLRRDVAIKLFRARAEDAAELRLQEAEAMLVASLNHFALTTLHDVGVDTSDPEQPRVYLVMEHVPGGDLRQRLRRGALRPVEVAHLGTDLGAGLQVVHEAGFLHRDIKPANVLLHEDEHDDRLRAKLADFGISTLIGHGECGEVVTGTAAYLSPEQAVGEEAGPDSDVYSLGLVLLEALTGRVAFPGDVLESAMARLDHDPLVPVAVPEPLADVLRAMTRRDRAARPPLVDVVTALHDWTVDEHVRRRAPERPIDPSEAARLEALRRYNILDSPAEDAFDDVTELLCRSLHLPIAIIALVDEDRAWFKSRRGVPLPEVPREATRAFAETGGEGTWMVPDVLAVPSLQGHPFVAGEPFVRSAIAAPMLTHDGQEIGRVLACDIVPRTFVEDEVATVETCARIVMRELELRFASRRALFPD